MSLLIRLVLTVAPRLTDETQAAPDVALHHRSVCGKLSLDMYRTLFEHFIAANKGPVRHRGTTPCETQLQNS